MSEVPQIISRKEARARGLSRYYGKPCRFGHDGLRYTCHGHCIKCDAISRAQYRANNRQMLRDKNRKYRSSNKEKLADSDRRYRAANRELIKIKTKARRERKKQQKQVASKLSFQELRRRPQAIPIAAPDWNSIEHDMNTTIQRAERYRDIYRAKKNSFGH